MLGYRIVGEVIDVSQHDDRPQFGWKGRKSDKQLRAHISILRPLLGIALPRKVSHTGIAGEFSVCRVPASLQQRVRRVGRNSVQPRADLGVAPEAADRAKGPKVRVLHHVVGVFGIADQS